MRGISRLFILSCCIALISLLNGCSKITNPNRLERIIQRNQWKINSIFIENVDRTAQFSDYTFKFLSDNTISVGGDTTISGKWEVGPDKNPTLLQLTITPIEPFFYLNYDWEVVTLSDSQITLQVVTSGYTNNLILSKSL